MFLKKVRIYNKRLRLGKEKERKMKSAIHTYALSLSLSLSPTYKFDYYTGGIRSNITQVKGTTVAKTPIQISHYNYKFIPPGPSPIKQLEQICSISCWGKIRWKLEKIMW
jgi:hypothetical protein